MISSCSSRQPRLQQRPMAHVLWKDDYCHRRGNPTAARNSLIATATATTLEATKYYDQCDIAVMGGGFGGLYTALSIAKKQKQRNKKKKSLDIVLVDPSDQFVFLPLLYDLTMGTATSKEVCPSYKELLDGTNIRHIKASLDEFSLQTNKNDQDRGLRMTAILKKQQQSSSYHDGRQDHEGEQQQIQDDEIHLSFEASVIAVGATPQSILATVPGATKYAQPFYTQRDAYATREILYRMDQKIRQGPDVVPRLAVVGGGYGGVEMAACLARRLPKANVTLMTRNPPMKGTRAEPVVDQALKKLGVRVELCTVDRIVPANTDYENTDDEHRPSRRTVCQVKIQRTSLEVNKDTNDQDGDSIISPEDDDTWDAVFWTAGSSPAYPVPDNIVGNLAVTESGRLAVDETLRCSRSSELKLDEDMDTPVAADKPLVWSLGDCSEIISAAQPSVPRTAQAAMQQADVVASNVLFQLDGQKNKAKKFKFLDIGTLLSLGGPNGAVVGPKQDSQFEPLLVPLLDTARFGLTVADKVFTGIVNSPQFDKKGVVAPVVENLGLSLGGYGLGVDPNATPGTISGTLSGLSRRAIYALRMPTNRQRACAAASSFISSAAALAKEASVQIQNNDSER